MKNPPSIKAKLEAYKFQIEAVDSIRDLPYAAVFHEQGLGKTKIAIDLLLGWFEKDQIDTAFIVTKKSLIKNWLDELKIHSHLSPAVLTGNRKENSNALNSPVLVYVLNYEILPSNLDLLSLFLKTCRVAAILDESHKIKNPDAKVSKAFHSVSEDFEKKVIMSGTPVANRPYDLWSQIKFLDEGESLGTSFNDFKEATDIDSTLSDEDGYAERLAAIYEDIQDFTIRETKISAGIKLPNKSIHNHFVEMQSEQLRIYNEYKHLLRHEIWSEGALTIDDAEAILKRLLRLVQCASNPFMVDETYSELPAKYTKLLELITENIPNSSNIIIWSGFIKNIEWLYNQLREFNPAISHGALSVDERNNQIGIFKTQSHCRILLATPGTAKEGLTLTNANHVVFYDRSFSLDDYLQAQDRIHRISQTEECFVHNLIANDSIDIWVDSLLEAKSQVAKLAQGDINTGDFLEKFNFDLKELLSEVLDIEN